MRINAERSIRKSFLKENWLLTIKSLGLYMSHFQLSLLLRGAITAAPGLDKATFILTHAGSYMQPDGAFRGAGNCRHPHKLQANR